MWYPLEEMYIDNTAGVSKRHAGHSLHPGLTGLRTIVSSEIASIHLVVVDVVGAGTSDVHS